MSICLCLSVLYITSTYIFNMLFPPSMKPSAKHLPLLQQQVGNLLHARVWLQAMGFGAVRNGHGSRQPEVDPTRGPPPNQGSQGSPLLMEGWKVATFWMVGNCFRTKLFGNQFFSWFFFGCENDINGSLNRRLSHVVQISCQKLCCFFQCEPSVKVVPDDDPWKRLWTCLLAPNHGLMMIEDSPREPRNHVMTSMKCHGCINPSNSSVLRMVQFWVNINTIVILHVIAQSIKKL